MIKFVNEPEKNDDEDVAVTFRFSVDEYGQPGIEVKDEDGEWQWLLWLDNETGVLELNRLDVLVRVPGLCLDEDGFIEVNR